MPMHYDPAHAELEVVFDRLESERRRRDDAEPGSQEDLDAYEAVRELEAEFRDRLRIKGARTVGIRPRQPHFAP